jgi:LysM repeat protein
MATKSEKIQAESPAKESILAIATKPLPAALLRIAPIAEPEASQIRWVGIVAGVAVLFGLIIAGNYWLSQRGRAQVAANIAPPTGALAKPIPAAAEPLPTANPTPPQLFVDPRPFSSQSAPDQAAMAPAAEQSPVPSPGQPLQPLSSEPVPVQEAAVPAVAQLPVPAPSQPPHAVEHQPRYITIAEGQSLIRIARANHVPAAAITAANHLKPPYALRAGSRLLIPEPTSSADQDAQATGGKTQ